MTDDTRLSTVTRHVFVNSRRLSLYAVVIGFENGTQTIVECPALMAPRVNVRVGVNQNDTNRKKCNMSDHMHRRALQFVDIIHILSVKRTSCHRDET